MYESPILSSFSAAQRLSWLANRSTTRVEDMAYCMLGIMELNMPLLYGEGDRAFKRLQFEIINRYGDESILTWKANIRSPDMLATYADRFTGTSNIWRASLHDRPALVLASNCAEFRITTGRRGVLYHRQARDIYLLRLNCVCVSDEKTWSPSGSPSEIKSVVPSGSPSESPSEVTSPAPSGSPCIILVRRASCKQNHFVRTMGSPDYIKSGVKFAYCEEDVAHGGHWMPVEAIDSMFVHLDASDVNSCRGDLPKGFNISYRLRYST